MGKVYQILLLEDDESVIDNIEIELSKRDITFQLDVIQKEEQLVDRLQNNPPDLVISNYNLPVLTGSEVLRIIRKRHPQLPLILVVSSNDEEKAVDAMREGASDYVVKQNLNRLAPAIRREIDNYENYKKQRAQLEENRVRYQNFVQSVNGIVWEADAETFEFNYVSPQSEQLLGYTPDEWLQEPDFWQKHIHPDDRRETVKICQNKTQQGEDHSFEYRMLDANDEIVWMRDYVTVVMKNGKPDRLQGLMVDFSKEKKAERQRDKAYEIANIGHWELDLMHDELYWSKAVRKLHEVDSDYKPELDTALEFYKEGEHRQKITTAVEDAIETGKSFDEELKIVTPNGNEKWVRAVGETEFRNGKCIRIYGSTQEVTQRKKAEQKLREMVEHSTNMFYRHDTNHVLSYVSPQAEEFLGYKPAEAKRKWTEFVTDHPVNNKGLENTQKAIDTGETQSSFSLQLEKKNGKKIWVRVNEAPIVENGETVAIVGSLTDITEQKNLEQLLQQTNRLAEVGSWELDMSDGNNEEMYWSEMTREIIGVDADYTPTLTEGFEFFEPESKERIQNAVDKAINEGVSFDEELLINTANGSKRWIRCIGQTDFIDGECKRMYGSFQDIHKRKEAEIKMKEAFQEREKILDRINEAFFAIDQNWSVTYWNKQAEEVIGVKRGDVIGKNLWEKFPEAKERKFFQEYERALNKQISVQFEEYYPPLDEWLEVNAYPSEEGLSIFFRDITDRKKVEQSLREINRKNRLILESTAEGIYGIDTEGKCTFINGAAANMLGYRSEECIGENMHELIHHKHANGEPYPESECPIFISKNKHESCRVTDEVFWKADDTCFNADYTSNPMIEDGEIKGAVVAFSDITERKQHEKKLQESIKEKETLLMEIHHRVKNNLAVVSGMMQLQAFNEEDESLKDKLFASVIRIRTMASIHELLYQSNSYSNLQLGQNIKKLVSNIMESYQIDPNIRLDFNLKSVIVNINQAIPCSLIVNEVVTNAYKHAFDKSQKGTLSVKIYEESKKVYVQIKDNGKGLPEDFESISKGNSLGLKLIDTLATQLDGEYSYESSGRGTLFTLNFKKADVKGIGNARLG